MFVCFAYDPNLILEYTTFILEQRLSASLQWLYLGSIDFANNSINNQIKKNKNFDEFNFKFNKIKITIIKLKKFWLQKVQKF